MKSRKFINLASFALLISFQAIFILAIINEHKYDQWFYTFTLLFVVLAWGIVRASDGLSDEIFILKDSWQKVLGVCFGAVMTYVLSVWAGGEAVLAACIVGLFGVLLSKLFVEKQLELAIYCGTFVGMSSTLILHSVWEILLAATISGIVFVLCKNNLRGVGGKLGTIAFVGVATLVFILKAVSWQP